MHSATDAVLLVGPTGSGKTPLGDCLEARGWQGRRCAHFDFGAQLRAAVQGGDGGGLDADSVRAIRQVLETGALLEDHQFPIARRILDLFIAQHQLGTRDLLVLNGLPRHVGQAQAVSATANVSAVVRLQCSATTVHERIAGNSGGDRGQRIDDGVALIQRKLDIYSERTAPLVAHYHDAGIPVIDLEVEVATTATALCRRLHQLALE